MTMDKKNAYEGFKIDSALMEAIRKFAKADGRTIKETVERVLRERFLHPQK